MGIECCLDYNNNSICDADEGLLPTEGNETGLSCVTEGNTIPVIAQPPECCEGLELIPPKEAQILGISGYCTANCGDGICDSTTESELNCHVDCEEEYCVPEGGALPVIPDAPVCCNGLSVIDVRDPGIVGVSGYCTNRCGDGLCNTSIESNYNCPIDCTVQVQAEPEPCGDGICDLATEDSATCCVDCGCEAGNYCSEGACIETPTFAPISTIQVQMFSFCGDDICSVTENSSADCCSDCGCPSGQYCSNNTCLTGTPPLFMPMFIPMTVYIPSAETMISDPDGGGVGKPTIYGNKVTFHQYYDARPRTQIYDTITKTRTLLPHDTKTYDPYVSGGKIVWYEYGRPIPDNSDIYLYDFGGGVEGIISPRPDYQMGPKIYGNAVIWEEQMSSGGEYTGRALFMYWIPNSEERILLHNIDLGLTGYAIWGGNIIYSTFDCSGGIPCLYEITKYDISTNLREVLTYTDSGEEIKAPAIWGNKVAYVIEGSTNDEIFVIDLNTKLTLKLNTGVGEKWNVEIYEDKVVWSDERNGNHDIFLYDMSDGTETQITSSTQDETLPDIYGDIIVYKKSGDIYMYKLS
jgi:beta propeller repeat protein